MSCQMGTGSSKVGSFAKCTAQSARKAVIWVSVSCSILEARKFISSVDGESSLQSISSGRSGHEITTISGGGSGSRGSLALCSASRKASGKVGRSMVDTKLSWNAGVSFLISMVIFLCISVHLAFPENEKGRSQMNESTATGLR